MKNKNIIEQEEFITGPVEDLKDYFLQEIKHQTETVEDTDMENFSDNITNILEVLNNLQNMINTNQLSSGEIVKVLVHPMGGYMIERSGENEK